MDDFSGIFSVYVDKYNNYSSFYGTMTTIALIMVWLYGCMYVLFIGGIINRTWEERMEAKNIIIVNSEASNIWIIIKNDRRACITDT